MIDRQRIRAVAFGVLALGAAVAFPATAAADEPLPDPVVLAPGEPPPPTPAGPTVPLLGQLGPTGLNVLAQTNAPPVPGTLGAPPIVGLDQTTVLGLNAVPSAPGGGPGTPPSLNVFNNAYGIQQYEVPSAPGGQQFDVAPGNENADVSRREWFGRLIDMQRDGRTYGGLGQAPPQQLGEPLPGTAPPPGTVISPGLVQFLPDPADGPTPPPGLVLPPPPPPPAG